MSQWKFWNHDGEMIDDPSKPFTLVCSPETDLWEKPPSVHSANAPCLLYPATKGSFISAKVTVSAEWVQKYDQGGLVLLVHDGSDAPKWVKTGVELFNGQPQVSTVSTYKWSDWSLRPMASHTSSSASIEIKSNEDGSLWVYVLDGDGDKSAMREIAWWGEIDGAVKISVGVYAAKPDKEQTKLVVSFEGLEIKTSEG
jgi:regulation of enolase protein 1 (concanavalin A-like superfamily)